MKLTYSIERIIIDEYHVLVQKDDEPLRTPIAKCNNEAVALTIKGMYEDKESQNEFCKP